MASSCSRAVKLLRWVFKGCGSCSKDVLHKARYLGTTFVGKCSLVCRLSCGVRLHFCVGSIVDLSFWIVEASTAMSHVSHNDPTFKPHLRFDHINWLEKRKLL